MQRDQAIKQIYTECGALIFLRILSSSGKRHRLGYFPWADLGFWPRCSHLGMHILLASLILTTGAMCNIVNLALHDVH